MSTAVVPPVGQSVLFTDFDNQQCAAIVMPSAMGSYLNDYGGCDLVVFRREGVGVEMTLATNVIYSADGVTNSWRFAAVPIQALPMTFGPCQPVDPIAPQRPPQYPTYPPVIVPLNPSPMYPDPSEPRDPWPPTVICGGVTPPAIHDDWHQCSVATGHTNIQLSSTPEGGLIMRASGTKL